MSFLTVKSTHTLIGYVRDSTLAQYIFPYIDELS